MANRTCSTPGCMKPHLARGLCSACYGIAYRGGSLPPKNLPVGIHSLTNINRETAVADCSICGPQVQVKLIHRGRHAECKGKIRTRKYAITHREFARLMESQSGRCAMCGDADNLCVDHDHATGEVRGLLCSSCNIALAWLRDDPEIALSAARYLRAAS